MIHERDTKEWNQAHPRCHNCRFFYTQKYGYSVWTVTNMEIDCLKDKNPSFPLEDDHGWHREDHQIDQYALQCDGYQYEEFAPIVEFDVDENVRDSADNYREHADIYALLTDTEEA